MSINLEQNKIFNQIKEILWSDWDPIGVNDCDDARDEYTSYTLQIFGMKIHNADKQNIADRLYKFEMVDMEVGTLESKILCEKIVQKIKEL